MADSVHWPVKASSKKMANCIKRWPAAVRILFILIRDDWPARASSKKMLKFNKRWPVAQPARPPLRRFLGDRFLFYYFFYFF